MQCNIRDSEKCGKKMSFESNLKIISFKYNLIIEALTKLNLLRKYQIDLIENNVISKITHIYISTYVSRPHILK